MTEQQYIIPKWLQFRKLSPIDSTRSILELTTGQNADQSYQLTLTHPALTFLVAFTEPSAISSAARRSGIAVAEATVLATDLLSHGFLAPYVHASAYHGRYGRHALYFDMIGIPPLVAQQRTSSSVLTFVGMGGIGTNITSAIIGAGFKEFRLVDGDCVELGNLTRQVLYSEKDIGEGKVHTAASVLRKRNRDTKITTYATSLTAENAKGIFEGSSLVIVSADSPRWITSIVYDACSELQVPYCNVGYYNAIGTVGPIKAPHLHESCLCLESLRIEELGLESPIHADAWKLLKFHYQAPSYGPLNAILGGVAAAEIMSFIIGSKSSLIKQHIRIDSANMAVQTIKGCSAPNCPDKTR